MNPAREIQQALFQWSKKMGYLTPGWSIADSSIFESACETHEQRRLWKEVLKKIKDRRDVRKIKYGNKSKSNPCSKSEEELERILTQLDEIESDRQRVIRRIKERDNEINIIHLEIRDREVKMLLFDRQKCESNRLAAKFKAVENKVLQFNTTKEFSEASTQEWLEKAFEDGKGRWEDPALQDELRNRFSTDKLPSHLLKDNFNKRHERFFSVCNQAIKNISDDFVSMRQNQKAAIKWDVYIQEKYENTMLAKTISLLLRGQGISALVGNFDSLKEEVLPLCSVNFISSFSDPVPVEDSIIDKLKQNIQKSDHKYETQTVIVRELRCRFEESYNRGMSAFNSFSHLSETLATQLILEGRNWGALLHQRNMLARKLSDDILKESLFEPSSVPSLDDKTAQKDLKNLPSCLPSPGGYHLTLEALLKGAKSGIGMEDGGDRANQCLNDLQVSRNMISTQSQKLNKVKDLLNNLLRPAFGSMIPDTYTVNGLTYREWEQECTLLEESRLPNLSVASHDFSLMPNFL